jgi:hypothetical protein
MRGLVKFDQPDPLGAPLEAPRGGVCRPVFDASKQAGPRHFLRVEWSKE